jgi:hypothetical protein
VGWASTDTPAFTRSSQSFKEFELVEVERTYQVAEASLPSLYSFFIIAEILGTSKLILNFSAPRY